MTLTLSVAPTDPREPDARSLIEALTAEMAPFYTAEETFGYPVEKLVAEGVFFVMARQGARPVACGGMQAFPGYGELKRFYAAPDARGTGAAGAVLHRVEEEAQARGLTLLRLETGRFQEAAIRFYARNGFATCARFGDYPANRSSVYMEKRLA